MKILVSTMLGLLLFSHTIFAQEKQKREFPANCEKMLYKLDYIDIASKSKQESLIIVVAYLGSGERSGAYNQSRLKAIEMYLTGNRGVPKEKLVLTEGKRRKGLGKVEFYIDGKLNDQLFIKKRGSICTFCCG